MANINELMNGWGFGAQADIATPNVTGKIWRVTKGEVTPNDFLTDEEKTAARVGRL